MTASAHAREAWPGLAIALGVAVAATALSTAMPAFLPLPAMVIALLVGIALNPFARREAFQPGLSLAVKRLLRIAVALLGLRIALGDIIDLGVATALIVIASMIVTIASGFALARLFGQTSAYGALAGAATAVCGASATLATATVLPHYKGKEADVAFVVVAVNALSTVAMVLYPLICRWLGMDDRVTGIMLGATIHDVAQVVGAGYAVSEEAGDAAVVVKLFRVFLLLPVVLVIGWIFASRGAIAGASAARVPIPVFALVFLALCFVNSAAGAIPAIAPVYEPIRDLLVAASGWGLLIAIAALGLGTSLGAIARLGWRHVATVTATTLVILAFATGLLLAL
ncbi:MAG: putative sulfate exporter family transporter [Salinarimonadaceae bacterium]|nr:MAG: putative sulfate exporter family transporter [Salinarimonadaceae bacterium]